MKFQIEKFFMSIKQIFSNLRWKKKTDYIHGIDFDLININNQIDDETEPNQAIRILSGKYLGVIYSYSHRSIKLLEDKDNDELRVKFSYKIHQVPKHLIHMIDSTKLEYDFIELMGNLLYSMITNGIGNFAPPPKAKKENDDTFSLPSL